MDERLKFVRDALSDRFTMSELCARYSIINSSLGSFSVRYAARRRRLPG